MKRSTKKRIGVLLLVVSVMLVSQFGVFAAEQGILPSEMNPNATVLTDGGISPYTLFIQATETNLTAGSGAIHSDLTLITAGMVDYMKISVRIQKYTSSGWIDFDWFPNEFVYERWNDAYFHVEDGYMCNSGQYRLKVTYYAEQGGRSETPLVRYSNTVYVN